MKVLYKTLLFAVILMTGFLILSTTAQSKQKVNLKWFVLISQKYRVHAGPRHSGCNIKI